MSNWAPLKIYSCNFMTTSTGTSLCHCGNFKYFVLLCKELAYKKPNTSTSKKLKICSTTVILF